jgi:IclR family transcriptional regulator, KDG regulon repressor
MGIVDKSFEILDVIVASDNTVSVGELAEATKLNKSTICRICRLLVKLGYIRQKEKRGNYAVGNKFLRYYENTNYAEKLKETSLPYIQQFSDEVGESINLSIINGIKPVGIAVTESNHVIRAAPPSLRALSTLPLHCTAMGKIFLAYKFYNRIENIIEVIGLERHTINTIIDRSGLIAEINIIRKDGEAFDMDEYIIGLRSIAVPVFSEGGKFVAALSIVGPSLRLKKTEIQRLVPRAKYYAFEISKLLGYKMSSKEKTIAPLDE